MLIPGLSSLLGAFSSSMFSTGLVIIANMAPDVESDQGDHEYQHDYIQAMEDGAKLIQIIPEYRTYIGKQKTPGKRAKESIDAEFHKRHPGDTGRQGDIGAYHRKMSLNGCMRDENTSNRHNYFTRKRDTTTFDSHSNHYTQ